MAIDTQAKRMSAMDLGIPWRRVLPIADGAIIGADMQHFLGLYSGIAADSTEGDHYGALFTITNIRWTYTFPVTFFHLQALAWFLGTLIRDLEEGTYLGTNYTIINHSELLSFDCDDASMTELARCICTLILDNPGPDLGANVRVRAINPQYDWNYDCNSVSLNELLRAFAALLSPAGIGIARPRRVIVSRKGPSAVVAARASAGAVTVTD
jgi:hypothetical protein